MKLNFNRNYLVQRIAQTTHKAVLEGAEHFKEALQELISTSGHSIPGSPPGLDTGKLKDSIQVIDVTKDMLHPDATVYSNAPYSRILEYGGRIVPKNAKYLTIPLVKGADKNGCTLTKRGDNLYLEKNGEFQFILKKEVYIAARPYWRPTIAKEAPIIKKMIKKAISKAIKGK